MVGAWLVALLGVAMALIGLGIMALFTDAIITMGMWYDGDKKMIAVNGATLQLFYGVGNVLWPLIFHYATGDSLWSLFTILSIASFVNGVLHIIWLKPPTAGQKAHLMKPLISEEINSSAGIVSVEEEPTLTPTQLVCHLLSHSEWWLMMFAFMVSFGVTVSFSNNMARYDGYRT
jgi:MFS family permease